MNILTIADVVDPALSPHPDKARFADVDLILSCGDLSPEYLTTLRAELDRPLFYVCGNHDIRYADAPPAGCTNLHARVIRHGGLRLLGLSGSRWYNGGPHQYTDAQMWRTILRLMPTLWWHRGVDIVVAHAPPRHVHDAEDRCHRGFKSFHRLIERFAPAYFLHGHIHAQFKHDAERIAMVSETQVINAVGHYRFSVSP